MTPALPAAAYCPDEAYDARPAAVAHVREVGVGFTSVILCEGTEWGRTREAAARPTGWFTEVRDVLTKIEGLSENWDHYGGAAPEPAAVHRAAVLLERLAAEPGVPRPTVGPTRGGAVQFEWENSAQDRYFEVEVPGEGKIELFFQDLTAEKPADREENEWEVDLDGCVGELIPYITRAAV